MRMINRNPNVKGKDVPKQDAEPEEKVVLKKRNLKSDNTTLIANEKKNVASVQNSDNQNDCETVTSEKWTALDIVQLGLKVCLWIVLLALCAEYEFGGLYVVVSSLFILYRCTRSDTRQTNKLSAYSIFNPNFERLDGTFTAEQFEKELRYGASSVR